jgi:hypothetical protein
MNSELKVGDKVYAFETYSVDKLVKWRVVEIHGDFLIVKRGFFFYKLSKSVAVPVPLPAPSFFSRLCHKLLSCHTS